MEQIGENIWAREGSMRIMGTNLRLRTTVIKLQSGQLWVYSPTELTNDFRQDLSELGDVAFIIGPANGHNLWLDQWQHAYPNAKLYVSAGIPKKVRLRQYTLLDNSPYSPWPDDLQRQFIAGAPFFSETVFLHRPSRSLLVCDLVQNHCDEQSTSFARFIQRFILQPIGFKDICLAPPLRRGFAIKDKTQLISALKTIQSWDFDRIIVTHGDIIEDNAGETFDQLCALIRT